MRLDGRAAALCRDQQRGRPAFTTIALPCIRAGLTSTAIAAAPSTVATAAADSARLGDGAPGLDERAAPPWRRRDGSVHAADCARRLGPRGAVSRRASAVPSPAGEAVRTAHQGWDHVQRYHMGFHEVPAIQTGEAVLARRAFAMLWAQHDLPVNRNRARTFVSSGDRTDSGARRAAGRPSDAAERPRFSGGDHPVLPQYCASMGWPDAVSTAGKRFDGLASAQAEGFGLECFAGFISVTAVVDIGYGRVDRLRRAIQLQHLSVRDDYLYYSPRWL